MSSTSKYDQHADWYDAYLAGPAAAHTARTAAAVADLLGPGRGCCLDVGCGTGVHADRLRALGWDPVGVDVSAGQLAIAVTRLPVARGDAAALPVRSGSVPAAVATQIHTDVDDVAAVFAEVARALAPGGRFAYVGVHPCFVGPFADRTDPDAVVLHPGYAETGRVFAGPGLGTGIRPRVGVRQVTVAALLTAVLDAGLTLTAVREYGAAPLPDLFGFVAIRPGGPLAGAKTRGRPAGRRRNSPGRTTAGGLILDR